MLAQRQNNETAIFLRLLAGGQFHLVARQPQRHAQGRGDKTVGGARQGLGRGHDIEGAGEVGQRDDQRRLLLDPPQQAHRLSLAASGVTAEAELVQGFIQRCFRRLLQNAQQAARIAADQSPQERRLIG